MLLQGSMVFGQEADPVVMTVAGKPVARSEFEYSYNKNNTEGVIDRKSVDEYVPLFVNYKLKVQAAYDARMDTISSLRKEFEGYRDQQLMPLIINDDDVEREAQKIYRETATRINAGGGLFHVSHILLLCNQKDAKEKIEKQRLRADSIYNAISRGADFADMARRFSDDKQSARNGGELPLLTKGQTVKEFEDAMMALQPGQYSKPVESPFGFHIILLKDKQQFFPYDSVKNDIRQFIEMRGLRKSIANAKADSLMKAEGKASREQVYDEVAQRESLKDSNLKYLIQEYHDGLLFCEIANREVWQKAKDDSVGLAAFYKKNKKQLKKKYKGKPIKDVKDSRLTTDYQDYLEQQWVKALRKKYSVSIDEKALATVNQHK